MSWDEERESEEQLENDSKKYQMVEVPSETTEFTRPTDVSSDDELKSEFEQEISKHRVDKDYSGSHSATSDFVPKTILDEILHTIRKEDEKKSEILPLLLIGNIITIIVGGSAWFGGFKWGQSEWALPINDPLTNSFTFMFSMLILFELILINTFILGEGNIIEDIAMWGLILTGFAGWFLFVWLIDIYFKNVLGGISASAITQGGYQNVIVVPIVTMGCFAFANPFILFGALDLLVDITEWIFWKKYLMRIKNHPDFKQKGYISAGNSNVLQSSFFDTEHFLSQLISNWSMDYRSGFIINKRANISESFIRQKAEQLNFAYGNNKTPPTQFDLHRWFLSPADKNWKYKRLRAKVKPSENVLWETPIKLEYTEFYGEGVMIATNHRLLIRVRQKADWKPKSILKRGVLGNLFDRIKHSITHSKRIRFKTDWEDVIGPIIGSGQKAICYIRKGKKVKELKITPMALKNESDQNTTFRKNSFKNLLTATRGSAYG
jgi:hypothetical protein